MFALVIVIDMYAEKAPDFYYKACVVVRIRVPVPDDCVNKNKIKTPPVTNHTTFQVQCKQIVNFPDGLFFRVLTW